MNPTKLIIVEGIPGSGKTSTAQYIKDKLDMDQISNRLYLEGDLNHPADYESVACLDASEIGMLQRKHPLFMEAIAPFIQVVDAYHLIYYGKYQEQHPIDMDQDAMDELRRFDVYNLSVDTYQELIALRWQEFVINAQQSKEIVILECCFLQNPMTMMFGRHNCSLSVISEFIKRLVAIIQPLSPKLIYFYQDDIRASLDQVIQERSKEWLEYFIWYFTEQGYGKSNGYQGLNGLYEVLQKRKQYELNIIDQLDLYKLVINNSARDWDDVLQKISKFI